jgi:GDP-D-mannose dehydratase
MLTQVEHVARLCVTVASSFASPSRTQSGHEAGVLQALVMQSNDSNQIRFIFASTGECEGHFPVYPIILDPANYQSVGT